MVTIAFQTLSLRREGESQDEFHGAQGFFLGKDGRRRGRRPRAGHSRSRCAAAGWNSHIVIGDHAVASWLARVDKEAVRNTKDVGLLVERTDFPRIVQVLESVGFTHQNVSGVDLFLNGPDGSVRSAVHILFADEQVRSEYVLPTPSISESEPGPDFPVPTPDALVRMKLTSFRLKDKVHLLDLLDVGLIDEYWRERLPPEIATRFEDLLVERAKARSWSLLSLWQRSIRTRSDSA